MTVISACGSGADTGESVSGSEPDALLNSEEVISQNLIG